MIPYGFFKHSWCCFLPSSLKPWIKLLSHSLVKVLICLHDPAHRPVFYYPLSRNYISPPLSFIPCSFPIFPGFFRYFRLYRQAHLKIWSEDLQMRHSSWPLSFRIWVMQVNIFQLYPFTWKFHYSFFFTDEYSSSMHMYHIFIIHLWVEWHWAFSIFLLLWIKQQWAWLYKYLWSRVCSPSWSFCF